MNNKEINELIFCLGKVTLEIYEYKKMKEKLDTDYKEAIEYLGFPDSILDSFEQNQEFIINEIIKEREANE